MVLPHGAVLLWAQWSPPVPGRAPTSRKHSRHQGAADGGVVQEFLILEGKGFSLTGLVQWCMRRRHRGKQKNLNFSCGSLAYESWAKCWADCSRSCFPAARLSPVLPHGLAAGLVVSGAGDHRPHWQKGSDLQRSNGAETAWRCRVSIGRNEGEAVPSQLGSDRGSPAWCWAPTALPLCWDETSFPGATGSSAGAFSNVVLWRQPLGLCVAVALQQMQPSNAFNQP